MEKTGLALLFGVIFFLSPLGVWGQSKTIKPTIKKVEEKDFSFKLLFFSDLFGKFVSQECKGGGFQRRGFLHLKQAAKRIRVLEREKGNTTPLVISGGNTIGPDAFGEYLFAEEKRAKWGVKFIEGMGVDVMAIGPSDISSGENFKRYLKTGHGAKLKFVATNIECRSKNDIKCRSFLKPYQIVKRKGVSIGFVVIFPKNQAVSMMKRSAKWVKFLSPEKSWKKNRNLLLKKEKVDMIILISHMDNPSTYPMETLKFLRKVGDDQPDLTLAGSSSSPDFRRDGNIQLLKRSGGSSIVGSSRFGQSLTSINLSFTRTGTRWKFNPKKISSKKILPRLGGLPLNDVNKLGGMVKSFCKKVDRKLGDSKLLKPMDSKLFLKYMLLAARVKLKGEIAILDKGLLLGESFPLSGTVTEEKIVRSIRKDAPLVVVVLKGSKLKSLLAPYIANSSKIMMVGFTKKKGKYFVNNRPLESEQHYRVITTKFIARGKGGFIKGIKSFDESNYRIRTLIVKWFEDGGSSKYDKNPNVNVKSDFPDLWENFVVSGGTNIGISMGNISTHKPSIYEGKTKLEKEDLKQVSLDVTFEGAISNRSHALSFRNRFLYGKTWTFFTDTETDERLEIENESADEIQINIMYQWKTIKNRWSMSKWWAPVPFMDGGLKSEFTPDINGGKDRYKLFTLVGGVGWELWENRLFFKVGGGSREEYTDQGSDYQQTIYSGWQLTNGELFKIWGASVKGESRLDGYFIKKEDQSTSYEIQATSKLFFTVSEKLFFNITHGVYAYRESGKSWSFAMDILLGINILFDVRIPFIL
jgi:5'-nucleotidase, C-terminal domain